MNRIFISILTVFALVVIADARPMKDKRDGQTYETVKIGNQVWMANNLNYATRGSYCYEEDASNCRKLGRLYTWDAALDACPDGWHLPTKEEFETLLNAIGGEDEAGTKLKSVTRWTEDGNGIDSYGFSALPAGYAYLEGYDIESAYMGDFAFFWTVNEDEEYSEEDAYYMGLVYDREDAQFYSSPKSIARSVRCLLGKAKKTSGSKGTLRDPRDGKTYKTVMIGNQEWMAENLNYSVKPGKQSWCYDNDESNCSTYGRLYTWAAAVGKSEQQCGYGKECKLRGQVQGVCPAGWHLPSKEEFEMLAKAAGGGQDEDNERVWHGAGIALKSRSGWGDYGGEGGNGSDALGFAALPAGYYGSSGDGFYSEGKIAPFWSSTESSSGYVYYLDLYYDYEYAGVDDRSKDDGFSVRCIKN